MSKITHRDKTPGGGDSVEDRLARLLDTPFLARVVPHLPPETLHQLIRYRGLDACGELVTSATPAQLRSLLDLDLWRPVGAGRDQVFNVDRFGEWLEVLVDTGTPAAARTVAALDRNLVVAGLSRYVRVLDPGIFEPTAQSDDEATDRHEAMREGDGVGTDGLECEVGGYIVRARRSDAWDAIVTLLLALDTEYPRDFHAVMEGCRRVSNSRPEIDGLDDLLMAPEQHLHDVAIARERRQSQQGYATPADARAFLEMARQPGHRRPETGTTRSIGINPIVTAYFRAADGAPEPSMSLPSEASPSSDVQARAADIPGSLESVVELLTEAGIIPQRPRALLEAADADPRVARLARVRRLMAHVRDTDETAYLTRSRELAFLANTLLAGCSVQSRQFTPVEASDAAVGICNLGLEYWPARWPRAASAGVPAGPPDPLPPVSLLIDHDLVTAFEVGWSVLHHDVSLFVAEQLVETLTDLHCIDRDIRHGLARLRRELVQQRAAGTPWRAREAADILVMLDTTAWISVLGLLDECPILPAAMTAVLEGRTTTVSQTEFDFISTVAQIGDVRLFMRKLKDVLSR